MRLEYEVGARPQGSHKKVVGQWKPRSALVCLMFKKDPSDTCVDGRWIERDLTGFQRLQVGKKRYSSIENRDGNRIGGISGQRRVSLCGISLSLART